ncbi:putative ubiquitinyl hydrolase 1 [Helianthus annuus]|uniref:Ubiquitin carboxyl-terminal hydrolase n=1 Tax=Helianthus annuus TaxID=4232 RepID=A0A251VHJ3_HELAN|nr:ubiquitin carboxyl-terminal hydrolase 8 [Helianthus annuus]KAF5819518.1 putative ubiquitinyl hydrolase 1 [Helianthus annuus]KAJ0787133.1 putative ubiquitinyl hydrolase 1 [Helianthus annuus]KAJ0941009.1 putative ubiquitinyl hydrolase 1 [Helianthus annuus]
MNHRFAQFFFAFSLIINFLSLKLLPAFRQFLSKTLDFLKMDSFFLFSDSIDEDSLYGTRSIKSLSDLDPEKLYLVDHRWWNEARESMFREVEGDLYGTSCGLSADFESEIVLDMRRCNGEEEGVSGREYALVSEWMFYRALKWHYDLKNVQNIVSIEDNKADLFFLQVRLSISPTNDSLVVRISEKDNEFRAFNKSCEIFSVNNTGLLKIWDFSGQITNLFLQGRMPPGNSGLVNDEISLELQVFGLSRDITHKENGMAVDSNTERNVNGHSDKVNPNVRLGQHTSSVNESYNLGLTGLYNLGNTCFMNSAIQCLAHTPQLVDYFLGDFRKDLNFENPLGMNGKLALAFGDLIRQLWTPGVTSVGPRDFRSRLVDFAPQFDGYNQHDSQEFLAFLLDGLHEDLNRVKIKPYNEIKDVDGIPDKEVANEHWRNHLARNDSIIVDMCQGQYRSTLICPLCKKHSVTFDPFLYLSLPLPSTTMRAMTLTVLTTDGSTLPVPVTVTVPKFGKFKDLIQALSTACSLRDDETLLVAEIYNNCILHFLDKPADSLELVRDHDTLVAYRLPKDQDSLPLVVFTHCHLEESNCHGGPPLRRFGIPLAARIPERSDGFELHKKFLQLLDPLVMPEEFSSDSLDNCSVSIADQDTKMDDVADDVADDVVIEDVSNSDDVTVKSSVDETFHFSLEKQGISQVRSKIVMDEPLLIPETRRISILVSWPEEMLRRYDTCILNRLPETGGLPLAANDPPESVSLYKCLEAFLKEEPLGPEDMWYCPKCKEHRQASKKLDLWRLPEILIIHLKRFSYNHFLKDKLETFVDFPIVDFDLSNYTVHKDCQSSIHYKLYAVSNHYGGMGGGHYTAFAQCGEQWYEFNDSQVFSVSEDQIKTSAAYVLFYKRV